MPAINISNDSVTATLNGHTFEALAVGDNIVITPVNPHSATSRHRNGDTMQESAVGDVHTIVINYQKYSDDDREMNSWVNNTQIEILGSINQYYMKDGEEFTATYRVAAGAITVLPTDTFNDQDGNDILSITIEARVKRTL